MTLTPTDSVLGAYITDLDLCTPLDAPTISCLRTTFHRYSVLVFRNQSLTEADQVRCSRYFGQPVRHPVSTLPPGPVPEITVISNVEADGKPIGALGNQHVEFHADLAFLHTPATFSALYAVEVPSHGGDTTWASGYAAYDALTTDARNRLANLKVTYRHSRPEYNPTQSVSHPLICVHPETRRNTIYLSPSHAQSILGWAAKESSRLLQEICAHITQPTLTWTHQWTTGDFVVWDNRCTMHARQGFDNRERRIMKRTQGIARLEVKRDMKR